ncbi:hypothetical protein CMEL01_15610, partial [Colletotrichum melonis]
VALEGPWSPSTRVPSRPFLVRQLRKASRAIWYKRVFGTPETSARTRLRCKPSQPYLPLFRPAAAPFENASHTRFIVKSPDLYPHKPCTSVSHTDEYAAPIENTQSSGFTS